MPYNITMLTSSPDLLVQQITTKTIRPIQIDYLVDGFINEIRESGGGMNVISTFFYIIVGMILLSTQAGAEYI